MKQEFRIYKYIIFLIFFLNFSFLVQAEDVSLDIESEKYNYTGYKYSSPFVPLETQSSVALESEIDEIYADDLSLESLRITGMFSDESDKYAILSGANEFFIAKGGHLYTETNIEVQGITAIIEKDKIKLITNNNELFELVVPE